MDVLRKILKVYLQMNTVKYYVDCKIAINYDKLQIVWSQFFTLLQPLVYIWSNLKLFIYWNSDSTCFINDKWVFGPSRIFSKFKLTFELWIQR